MAIPFQTMAVDPDGNAVSMTLSAPASASLPPPQTPAANWAPDITKLLSTGGGGIFKPLIVPSTSPDSQFSPFPESFAPGFKLPPAMQRPSSGKFGLNDKLIPGVPNYLLYGGGALVLAYVLARKRR